MKSRLAQTPIMPTSGSPWMVPKRASPILVIQLDPVMALQYRLLQLRCCQNGDAHQFPMIQHHSKSTDDGK